MECIQSALAPESDGDEPSASSQSVDSLSDTQTSVSPKARMGVPEYLADSLGVEEGDVLPDPVLRDLGVGPLPSTKLRSDIANKLEIDTLDDVILEELTIKDLDLKINGQPEGASKTASVIPPETVKAGDFASEQIQPSNS